MVSKDAQADVLLLQALTCTCKMTEMSIQNQCQCAGNREPQSCMHMQLEVGQTHLPTTSIISCLCVRPCSKEWWDVTTKATGATAGSNSNCQVGYSIASSCSLAAVLTSHHHHRRLTRQRGHSADTCYVRPHLPIFNAVLQMHQH